MKAKIVYVAAATLILAIVALAVYFSCGIASHLCSDDVEALSSCEVTRGEGDNAVVLFQCEGEGFCSKTIRGFTLTCDGKMVE